MRYFAARRLEGCRLSCATCICFETALLFIVSFERQAEMMIEPATPGLDGDPFNHFFETINYVNLSVIIFLRFSHFSPFALSNLGALLEGGHH